jgi:hypothetical protein
MIFRRQVHESRELQTRHIWAAMEQDGSYASTGGLGEGKAQAAIFQEECATRGSTGTVPSLGDEGTRPASIRERGYARSME